MPDPASPRISLARRILLVISASTAALVVFAMIVTGSGYRAFDEIMTRIFLLPVPLFAAYTVLRLAKPRTTAATAWNPKVKGP
jgi:uncharacterized protein YqhQ